MTSAQTRRHLRPAPESGNSLLIVMLTIAVLATVAGNLMWSASARYHVTYQSSSWQEALVAAEAGVDFGMAELRKRVKRDPADVAFGTPPAGPDYGWSFSPSGNDLGYSFPASNRPFAVSVHPGEGNSTMRTRVHVDVPGSGTDPLPTNFARSLPPAVDPFMCEQSDKVGYDSKNLYWYRIRSLGVAGVSGPARPSPDPRDNWLRRFSFVTDWRTSRPVDAGGPQVSRLVEVVAKPLATFRNALMSDRSHPGKDAAMNFRNQDLLLDSYDSRKGPYNALSNQAARATLASNGQVIGGNLAVIKGDSFTNGGTDIPAAPAANVTGQRRDDFFQDLAPVTLDSMRSDWTGVTNLGTLNGLVGSVLNPVASTDRDRPTRLRVNAIDLRGGKILNITAPPNLLNIDAPSYVKIYVEGDINVAADGSNIHLANGVRAIIYCTGNVTLRGLGIVNDSLKAGNLLIKGIQPPADGDGNRPSRSIYLNTILDFQGSIYAPDHDLTFALQAAGPTLVSGGSDPGVINGDNRTVEAQVNAARNKVNASTTAANTAIAQMNQAYTNWLRLPLPLNWLTYTQKSLDVETAQNALAIDQTFLSNLTESVQSQLDDHLRGYNGVYGSFVARTIDMASKTHVHYDEALRSAGPVNHYEIVNWFEDNTSRATVTW